MPHNIEEIGIKLLIQHLESNGHTVRRRSGTFDLEVDGIPAEVKTKNKCFNQLDFISLTEKQYQAAKEHDFDIYVVCNLVSDTPEFYKLSARALLSNTPRVVTSYEYDKGLVKEVARALPIESPKAIAAKASSP